MIRIGKFLLFCCLLLVSNPLLAWGETGHRVIGALAIDNVPKPTRQSLHSLLKLTSRADITEWCIWPDAYRSTAEGGWTSPLHYVNLPFGADGYEMNRDCADGLCVTEAISRFAAELGNTSLPVQQRREAFGFVCHFVGDLSQPLHAGYASDRGGNDFTIIVDGQTSNIHRFWDSTVINYKTGHWNSLQKELQKQFSIRPGKRWDESMPANWTTESYILATTRAYPVNPGITEEFTEESWVLIRQQLATGGRNLATVLTSVLGK